MKHPIARAVLLVVSAMTIQGCGSEAPRSGPVSDAADTFVPAPTPTRIDVSSMSPEQLLAEARSLQQRVLTLDSHADIPFDYATAGVNPCTRLALQVDVPKMREGGLGAVVLSVWVPQRERTPAGYQRATEQALTKLRAIHRLTEELCPAEIELARTPGDVERIRASGKLVALIGIENGYAMADDLSLLATYKEMGAIYMSLTHSGHNDLADSSTPNAALGDTASEHGGVSALGEQAIAEMNRLGIMVDVSHASRAAALDAMRLSRAPVIASHSSVRALNRHARNMDDETLLALRDDGGVIQIVALGDYVRTQGRPTPSVVDLVDHIDYAVKLIGVDHVGIASDFDGGGGIEGWRDASETANVTAELLRRGYGEEDIQKIWSGNFLRVWREAERAVTGEARRPPDS